MRKYKITMIISILVTIMLVAYMVVPMLSMADNQELNIKLTKVEINGGYQINVTGSSPSKIIALSYINDKKTIADFNSNAEAIIAYFEGTNATKMNITSDNYIDETINMVGYGSYTVYLRNENGEIQLAYITINNKTPIAVEATSQVTSDSKSILIKANSTSNIVTVKVLKTNDDTAPANFTNAANIINQENTTIEITYPIIEDGIYQVYVEDSNKNKKIQTINIEEVKAPEKIEIPTEPETSKEQETSVETEISTQPETQVIPVEPIQLQEPIKLEDILDSTLTEKTEPEPTKTTEPEPVKTTDSEPVKIDKPTQPESIDIPLENTQKDDDQEFEQIEDKTTTTTTKIDTGIQLVNDSSASEQKYPQTGTNNSIIIAGIIVSTVIAIFSYIKMKQK